MPVITPPKLVSNFHLSLLPQLFQSQHPQVAYLELQPQHWQSHQAPCKSLHPPIDQKTV